MSLRSIDLSAMFLRPSALSMRQPFVSIGEFGVFGLLEGVLIDYAVFAACLASIRSLCSCVCMPDTPEGFPSLSGSSVRVSALLPGESEVFDAFSGVLKSLAMLYE